MPDPLTRFNPDHRTVRAVEIFRAGDWNGDKYSIDDLDAMVLAFGDVGYSVPLKLGHDEVSGARAWGWVERIYRVGDVLKADFKDIPTYVFEWVFVEHAYDQVSIEIYFNLKRAGKTYKRALKAVALLGAETPAVSGLAPLREAIYAPDQSQFEKVACASVKVATAMDPKQNQPNPQPQPQPAPAALPPDVARQLSESQATIAALQQTIKDQSDAMTSLTASVAQLTAANSAQAIVTKLEQVKIPALREHLRHLYSAAAAVSAPVKFTAADGKQADMSLTAVLDGLVEHIGKLSGTLTVPNLRGATWQKPDNGVEPAQTFADASQELAAEVKKYMAEKGMNHGQYGDAMTAVLANNPALRQRYNEQMSGGVARH
ncbi:MAG: hypothetical protein HC889_00640 [Synechococcaceae cyanobacterium SM1_2_3]|nr:hypothetical protein [Synechococcaceae cyanobacterium SM1_2_3]